MTDRTTLTTSQAIQKVLVTGATGFLGRHLVQKLLSQGYSVFAVSRSTLAAKKVLQEHANLFFIEKDLVRQSLSSNDFMDIDAIIHLMGESIDGRWTQQKKKDIYNSRTESSKNLLINRPNTVKTILSSSAQGYYGNTGGAIVTEKFDKGTGFLADVCEAWEKPFRLQTCRTVQLRTSMILDSHFGALKKMLPLFKANLGAVLGDGQQWMSWIALDDMVAAVLFALQNQSIHGPINCASPIPLTNKQFTQSLCQVLDKWQMPAVPEFILKAMLGEMSTLVLTSCRLQPEALNKAGFSFKYEKIEDFFKNEF